MEQFIARNGRFNCSQAFKYTWICSNRFEIRLWLLYIYHEKENNKTIYFLLKSNHSTTMNRTAVIFLWLLLRKLIKSINAQIGMSIKLIRLNLVRHINYRFPMRQYDNYKILHPKGKFSTEMLTQLKWSCSEESGIVIIASETPLTNKRNGNMNVRKKANA